MRLDADQSPDGDVYVIMDNFGTHKVPKDVRSSARHPRDRSHRTPTSASRMNQVDRSFAQIPTRRIRGGTFEHVRALETAIDDHLAHHNRLGQPFVWTATADAILNKGRTNY